MMQNGRLQIYKKIKTTKKNKKYKINSENLTSSHRKENTATAEGHNYDKTY